MSSDSPGFVLTVDGSDFVDASVVQWDGTPRPTTYVSGVRVRATITAADVAQVGNHQVTVVNPAPGGGTSNPVTFVIEQGVSPVPVLSEVTPTSVTLGNAVTLDLTGSGFVRLSSVRLLAPGTSLFPVVTYLSATALRVQLAPHQLQTVGTFAVAVANPSPGGGVSSPIDFEVRAPVPVASALSHSTAVAGSSGDTLLVDGTGFYAGSTVRFNGGSRATTLVSPTRLRVILLAGDLATPGTFDVTVANPAPGGGISTGLPFTVTVLPPQVVGLPAEGGSAGRSGFSLAVDGANFANGAVVQWNGADRPTTYRSGTRLLASISAADVAAPGVARITVRNPGLPAPSNAVDFTLRVVGAGALTSQRVVDVPANDVIYDRTRGLLYASVPDTALTNGNSVIAIDPATGVVKNSVFVGSKPEVLAISDDGQFLYVSLRGSSGVRRLDLATMTPGLEFSLGSGLVVEDMLVLPGAPRSVVLAKMNSCCSPRHTGVFVYDDGVQRGAATPGHTGSNTLAFSGRSPVLYGYNNESTDFGFRTMVIDASGVRVASSTGGLIGSFYTRITGGGGRVYATNGAIVDPEQRIRTGSFSLGFLPAPVGIHADPVLGRVFFQVGPTLTAFDMNTMQSLGSVVLPTGPTEHPALARQRLVRWGTDGIAFRAGSKVYIVRTALAGP